MNMILQQSENQSPSNAQLAIISPMNVISLQQSENQSPSYAQLAIISPMNVISLQPLLLAIIAWQPWRPLRACPSLLYSCTDRHAFHTVPSTIHVLAISPCILYEVHIGPSTIYVLNSALTVTLPRLPAPSNFSIALQMHLR